MSIFPSKNLCVFVFLVVLLPVVHADTPDASNTLGSYSWEAIKVILSLAIVLGIFYLFVNVFKKYTGVSLKSHSTMKVIGGLSLGGKDKVVILQAGEKNLLLGISSAGITKLHEFDQDKLSDETDHVESSLSFSNQIEKILGKKES